MRTGGVERVGGYAFNRFLKQVWMIHTRCKNQSAGSLSKTQCITLAAGSRRAAADANVNGEAWRGISQDDVGLGQIVYAN